jgi:F-type H+-transporting ATPase subunit gamma
LSESTAALRHQIGNATDLQAVVRTMRALAASNIQEYERSLQALADYGQTVNEGLAACLRQLDARAPPAREAPSEKAVLGAVVFGSDQGLAGAFNEVIVEHALQALAQWPGRSVVWVVGERAAARLDDAAVHIIGRYRVPGSITAIASLVDRLQIDTETHPSQAPEPHIHLFHNRPLRGALYEPVSRRLLPLDTAWRTQIKQLSWPGVGRPEVRDNGLPTLRQLLREHLFMALYRACAESLASENASRLAAMERADRNIDELLGGLHRRLHAQRQASIDEELFDVMAGYEALSGKDQR